METIDDDPAALRARLRELEDENAALRATPRRRVSGRSVISGILIVVALLLAPIAAISGWARMQLVDTDRFVSTFAPLAEDPAVQDLVATQVATAIEESLDVPSLVDAVFDGVRDLGLPPRADSALTLLQGPAVDGIHSIIGTVSEDVVTSPQFADIWAQTLRVTHQRAIAVIQGDPNTALTIGSDGTLSIELSTVIESVKQALVDRGVGFADAIPVIDRTIPVLHSDALVLTQTLYAVAVAAGFWLPWVALALLITGVLLARDRRRASAWTGFGIALAFALLAAGLGIGRMLFIGAVSPSLMSADAADAIFGGITDLLLGTTIALALAGALIAASAWYEGDSRFATNLRAVLERGMVRVRAAADRNGIGTGAFGRTIDRWRSAILIAAVVLALLWIVLARPITVGTVLAALVSLTVVLLLVEVLRRPEGSEVVDADEGLAEVADPLVLDESVDLGAPER
ncbi:hypothetical protein [Microbacterium istanbulense]|uniref:Integral membrane protein n=1 Tax=Microbacterium istanbulense TaxID=3122049 RepID=A0ABU8LL86_9MICO